MSEFDLTDYGEMYVMAHAAIGLFPRIEIDPQDVVNLIDRIKSRDQEIKRLQMVIINDAGCFTKEQIAALMED